MLQIYDMGPAALLPLRRKARWGFSRPKNPTASAGFEPANLGTKGQHATPRAIFTSNIRSYICTVYSCMRNSDAVSTLRNSPRVKKVSVIKILSGRRKKVEKIKELIKIGLECVLFRCLSPKIRDEWSPWPSFLLYTIVFVPNGECMHVFQQTAVGVLRPNHIAAETSWNVAPCSVLLGKFLLHIYFITIYFRQHN